MPVPIDARIVGRARIVEMNRADISQTNGPANAFNRRFQSIFFTNVVARRERMRRVNTHTQRKVRTFVHDCAQMLEAVPNALALSGSVFKQHAKLSELKTLTREFQAVRTRFDSICLA